MKRCPDCAREYADSAKFCPRDGTPLAAVQVQTDPLLGRVIAGNYEVLKYLGGGGFGTVYKVRNLRLEDIEALKIIHPEHLRDQEPLERFRREAKVLRRLGRLSTHIVDLYTIDEDDAGKLFYFTMEYVDGVPFTQLLLEQGALPVDRALRLTGQICDALSVAHTEGVIHRDLKLDNVLLAREGDQDWIKILDFGIAKVVGQQSLTDLSRGMPGTVGYAAPEQIKALQEQIGPPTDLFATGVILFNLLTGMEPWKGKRVGEPFGQGEDWEVIQRTLEQDPIRPTKLVPTVPPALERIVLKLLNKDPGQRFQSAVDLHAALAEIQPSTAPEQPQKTRRMPSAQAGTLPTKLVGATPTIRGGQIPSAESASGRLLSTFLTRSRIPAAVLLVVVSASASFYAVVRDRPPVLPEDPPVGVILPPEIMTAEPESVAEIPEESERVEPEARPEDVLARPTNTPEGAVSIQPGSLASIELRPTRMTLEVGATAALSATLLDAAGNAVAGRMAEWSSMVPGVADVRAAGANQGRVAAVAPGEARITVRSGGRADTALVTVVPRRPPPVALLRVEPIQARLEEGQRVEFQATSHDSEGVLLTDRQVQWSTDQPEVARVAASGSTSGTVVAVGPGNARLLASVDGQRVQVPISVVARADAGAPAAALAALHVDFDGEGLRLRTTIQTRSYQGRPTCAAAFFFTADETPLPNANGPNALHGKLALTRDFTPTSAAHQERVELTLPAQDLQLDRRHLGTNRLKAQMMIWEGRCESVPEGRSAIATSPPADFCVQRLPAGYRACR